MMSFKFPDKVVFLPLYRDVSWRVFRAATRLDERCVTCGLIGACWCQPGCMYCNYPLIRERPKLMSVSNA